MSLSDNTTRSVQIVAGSSTTTIVAPNTFTYRFPASGFKSGKDEIALKSLTIYNSWPNISAAKGNNAYSYVWPGQGSFPVVVADGIWSFAEFYVYLQEVMKANNHYLVDATGHEQYFLTLTVNPALYCLSLVADPLPTTLPAGWTNPGAVDLTAAAGNTPQLVIPAGGLTDYTGFAAGSYPTAPQTTIYTVNSGIPQVTDATSLNVLCDLVDNSGFSLSPNILASFVVPSDTRSGALVQIQPINLDWVPIRRDQTFGEINISIVDQLNRPLTLRDTSGFVAILQMRRRM
jgi:hypothetical protein